MAFIPDLEVLRGPASAFYRISDPLPVWFDLAAAPPTATVYAIGWLGDTVDTRGNTPEECIGRLLQAYEAGHRFSDGLMGSHTCEICPPSVPQHGYHHPFDWNGRRTTLYGHGHHIVLHDHSVFICPALILHYIVDHQYRPPAVFIDAVLRGTFLIPGANRGISPGMLPGPGKPCESCGQSARYWRDDRLLCEACYEAFVPSWARRPADGLDGANVAGTDGAAGDLARVKRIGQLGRVGRRWVLSMCFAVMFSVATVQSALSSEWGDALITAPLALVLTVLSLRWRRRMRAPPEEDSAAAAYRAAIARDSTNGEARGRLEDIGRTPRRVSTRVAAAARTP